jgi:hypothetical protein
MTTPRHSAVVWWLVRRLFSRAANLQKRQLSGKSGWFEQRANLTQTAPTWSRDIDLVGDPVTDPVDLLLATLDRGALVERLILDSEPLEESAIRDFRITAADDKGYEMEHYSAEIKRRRVTGLGASNPTNCRQLAQTWPRLENRQTMSGKSSA